MNQVKVHGPPKIADRDPNFPFLLVSPQLPADQDWDLAKLAHPLAWALKTLPADPDRVYPDRAKPRRPCDVALGRGRTDALRRAGTGRRARRSRDRLRA